MTLSPAIRCAHWPRALVLAMAMGLGLGLTAVGTAAELKLQLANLDNPYFPDRAPDAQPKPGEGYRLAPPPAKALAIEGDRLSLGFTLVSGEATTN